MPAIEIKPGVHWIGVNDRTTDFFEGLWPITREGISYNAYYINDQKKAIIDLSKSIKSDEFFNQIDEIGNISDIDYIIINHMEPDHSGVLSTLKRLAPRAMILGTSKTMELLKAFYGITENVRVVEDGETLELGKMTLKFVHTPFVHWPETMMTYEVSNGILFSCDGFGGYGALQGALFDDEYKDLEFYIQESLRYFTNIVANFSKMVLKAIDKLSSERISIVAPSHGLVWRKNPEKIIELYKKWSGYAGSPGEAGVTLLYGSMYGCTEQMMNAVSVGVSDLGLPVQIFDAARTHVSYILSSLWTNKGVIVGAPTYEGTLFPPVAQTLDVAVRKGIKNKKAAYFGSFGWGGGAYRHLGKIVEQGKWDLKDKLEFNGRATPEELKKGEAFGAAFAKELL